ncbi:MAG: Ig-like domain-containing protein [Opitutaceae bacterium]
MISYYSLFVTINRWAICFIISIFLVQVAFTAGFQNIDRPGETGNMIAPPFALGDGRSAIMAWHNGLLYSIPEQPGSADDSSYLVRSWDFSDLAAPIPLGEYGITQHPVLAHGYLYRNNTLILGDNFEINRSFEATDVYGVNLNVPFTEMDPPIGVNGHGVMYHPFNPTPSYSSYQGNQEDAEFRRMNPETGIWETLATWDHLSLTGVGGYPFVVGNLLIYASDSSRSGLAIYDISDLTQPVLISTVTDGGPGGYWPSLWGGDGRLYAVWAYRQEFNEAGNGIRIIDITDPTDPQWVIDAPLPDEDQTMYVMFQDEYAFLGNHKFDMRSHEVVLSFPTEANGRDSSQFALPLGNLVLLGGYGEQQGISIWVHQDEADTRPPAVGFHIPQDGQTNYPVSAPISLLIHEVLETTTIINGDTIILRPVGGDPLDAQFSRSFDGVLTFLPDAALEANTSYEVLLDGIEDASGNAMEPYSFTFSTGETVSGNAAPNVESLTANLSVVEPGAPITLTAVASDDPAQTLEYRFDAGDGSPKTPWDSATSVDFIYAEPGHYQPTVQVRDTVGAIASLKTGINVMTLPLSPAATYGSPVAIDAGNRRIWTVNSDNDTATVVDADSLAVLAEVSVGDDPRSVAIDPSGNVWITCHDEDRVRVFDGATYAELAEFNTGYGSGPFEVVISPDGQTAYVSLFNSGRLMRFDVAARVPIGSSLELGYSARALAVSRDGSRVLVTRFISPQNYAEIWEVETAGFSLNRTLRIPKFGNTTHRDSSANSRGVANYLTAVLYDPDGESAWVAATKQNTERGELFNAPQTHESTQRNLLVQIDLDPAYPAGAVQLDIDLDNSDSASGLGLSPRGDYLFVTLQGNNQYLAFDLLNLEYASGLGSLVLLQNIGAAPQGVAVDPETGRIFIRNFLDRDLSVIEGDSLFETGGINLSSSAVSLVSNEALAPEVLSGKRIFYHAEERMSSEGYISCASCHIDGSSDGRVWDFTQRGEGLRNTPELRGRSGMGHGRVHWTGNFDEIQDFENDIRGFFGGTGFMSDTDFATTQDTLGTPKTGLSPELDALAAYVDSLDNSHLPRSPYREGDGNLSEEAEIGRQVYSAMNCALCHGGEELTDSNTGFLHDLGTLRTTSGQRLGETLEGVDAPTLRGLWANAPYFHDGSATSLEDVLSTAGGTVYQTEDASAVSGGIIQQLSGLNIFINYDNSVMGGLVQLESSGVMTYDSVDGGDGGVGAIEFRYSATAGGTATVWVNGDPYPVAYTGTGNTTPFRMTFWSVVRIENVNLLAGSVNTIEIGGTNARIGIDHFTVSTPNDLAIAAPHRAVPVELRPELLTYLRSLDGGVVEVDDPAAPSVVIAATEGQNDPVDWPFVEFDLHFSEPVIGFDDTDLIVEGSAGPGWLSVYPITEGLSYRVRVGGFSNNGEVTLRLNIGAAESNGFESRAVFGQALAFETPLQTLDPLAVLNDEFDDASSLATWERLHLTEGWNADKLDIWDVDTSESGHMRLTPVSSAWYSNLVGSYAYREVTGDFIATVRMDVSRRADLAGRPSSNYSYGGLMVRAPRPYSNAGLSPGSDWIAGTENRIAINFGTANSLTQTDPNQWELIVSNSINSSGGFYPSVLSLPEGQDTITLQIARVGSQFVVLRQSPGGDWIIEQSFDRIDMPDTLQIGVIAGADYDAIAGLSAFDHNRTVSAAGTPDVVVDVDWFRVATPSSSLTPSLLASLPTTGQLGPISLLALTEAASQLGDVASVLPEVEDGTTYPQWLATHRNDDELANRFFTDPYAAPAEGELPNILQFVLGAQNPPALEIEVGGSAEARIVQLNTTRDSNARAVTLVVESSTDFETWDPIVTSANGEAPTGEGTTSESTDPIRELTVEVPADSDAAYFRVRAFLRVCRT